MTDAATLPPLLAALVGLLLVVGAALALIGSIGLLRLNTFYERIHPPTMATTLGLGLTLIASMLLFSALQSRPVLHEIVIAVFMVVTTPVTFMLLLRAALHRDAAEGNDPLSEKKSAGSARGRSRQEHITVGLSDNIEAHAPEQRML
jgi:multicomponent K+:H+ antiporter subunit G